MFVEGCLVGRDAWDLGDFGLGFRPGTAGLRCGMMSLGCIDLCERFIRLTPIHLRLFGSTRRREWECGSSEAVT